MEHPILFNSEMVRAILDGRKTQTRRPIKSVDASDEFVRIDNNIAIFRDKILDIAVPNSAPHLIGTKNPFGKIGDYLWVRESLRRYKRLDFLGDIPVVTNQWFETRFPEYGDAIKLEGKWTAQYAATDTAVPYAPGAKEGWAGIAIWQWKNKTIPSIHMPRWASRITLQIINIDVKRVHDIIDENQQDWDSDYGKTRFSWANNPWVWAIEFERI